MRSENKEAVRLTNELHVFNNCQLAKLGDGVSVSFTTPERGRYGWLQNSGWSVSKEGKNLGQDWRDHNSRWFRGKKADNELLMKVLRFATDRAKCNRWVRSPFGGYVTTVTADAVGIKYRAKDVIEVAEVGNVETV
jgi:hypothetical protein